MKLVGIKAAQDYEESYICKIWPGPKVLPLGIHRNVARNTVRTAYKFGAHRKSGRSRQGNSTSGLDPAALITQDPRTLVLAMLCSLYDLLLQKKDRQWCHSLGCEKQIIIGNDSK